MAMAIACQLADIIRMCDPILLPQYFLTGSIERRLIVESNFHWCLFHFQFAFASIFIRRFNCSWTLRAWNFRFVWVRINISMPCEVHMSFVPKTFSDLDSCALYFMRVYPYQTYCSASHIRHGILFHSHYNKDKLWTAIVDDIFSKLCKPRNFTVMPGL